MFGLLFPKTIDNKYRGLWLAIILFVPILLLKLIMGFNFAGFNPTMEVRDVLQDVDGVPLDRFSEEAVSEILSSASGWGLSLFTLTLFGVVALIRYRAMAPLAIFFVAFEQVARQGLGVAEQGLRLDDMTAGNIINWVFSIVLVSALILSMIRRRGAPI